MAANDNGRLLGREAFLSALATTVPAEVVEVPELGGPVRLVGFTAREKDEWETDMLTRKARDGRAVPDASDFRAKLLVRTIRDADGRRIFTDADVPILSAIRVDAIDRLVAVARRLCGLSQADLEELGQASAKGRIADSPTSSPSSSDSLS